MNDTTDKLSSLMDDELRDRDQWLQHLTNNAEMQEKWKRYHFVRDVMKGQLSEQPRMDISASVRNAIKNEPAILTPIWQRLNPGYLMKQAAGLAVAAAVGTIAVLSVQQAQLSTGDVTVALSNPSTLTNTQQDQIREVSFTTREKLDEAVESKLSGYLVNHNEFAKSSGVSRVMPYTRIVSFVPSSSAK